MKELVLKHRDINDIREKIDMHIRVKYRTRKAYAAHHSTAANYVTQILHADSELTPTRDMLAELGFKKISVYVDA